ncbi:MAG: tyrosine-type recombinase/integrase [Janthinobacterium lividum]
MPATIQQKFADLFAHPYAGRWLTIQCQLGKADNTVEAYGRGVRNFISFCQSREIDYLQVRKEHIAAYIQHMFTQQVQRAGRQQGLSNSTMHQRLTAVHLFYDFLAEEQLLTDNPIMRGTHRPGQRYQRSKDNRRGLLPRYKKLPWIPSEQQWHSILAAAMDESLRTRLMLALAYDGALRREELCSLSFNDIDPAYRLIKLQAENTKSRTSRVVHYSQATSQLYATYIRQRMQLSRVRGPLLLSESNRNRAEPLSIWSWSKTVQALAQRAGVEQFTTHTLRHLRLTDLARSGMELNLIASYAGHKSLETTMLYIHLSGREIADKLSASMDTIHRWREQTITRLVH